MGGDSSAGILKQGTRKSADDVSSLLHSDKNSMPETFLEEEKTVIPEASNL